MPVLYNPLYPGLGHTVPGTWETVNYLTEGINLWFKQKSVKMKSVQGIFFYCYFTKKCNTHKLVGLYLALLWSSQRVFSDHKLGSQWRNKLPAQAFTILSSKVTRMRPNPAQISSMSAALTEQPGQTSPSPTRFRENSRMAKPHLSPLPPNPNIPSALSSTVREAHKVGLWL